MNSKPLLASMLIGGTLCVYGTAFTATYEMLPPPQLTVVVDAVDVEDVEVQAGAEYYIYVSRTDELAYSALVLDSDGVRLYEDVPTRTKDCDDSSVTWPDRTVAHVVKSEDPAADAEPRAELIAYARSLNPCVLILDLPLTGTQNRQPGEPNPGHGDRN